MTSGAAQQRDRAQRRPRADGERTRGAILRAAASLATVDGLEGLSIGNLAAAIGMSKSGLYAHFGSKQELQLATVEEAAATIRWVPGGKHAGLVPAIDQGICERLDVAVDTACVRPRVGADDRDTHRIRLPRGNRDRRQPAELRTPTDTSGYRTVWSDPRGARHA